MSGGIYIDGPARIRGARVHIQRENKMLFRCRHLACERIKKSAREARSTTGVPVMPTGSMLPHRKTGLTPGTEVSLPDYRAGGGVERINIIRFGYGNDHRPIRSAFDVKGLGVNIAGDRAVEVQVTRQVCCRGRRERSVNVNAVAGRVVVFLRDVDLRVCLEPTQHGDAEHRNYRS